MTASENSLNTITYKTHSFEIAALPAATLVALANRGLGRVLGSEVSSKVVNWKASQEKETGSAPDEGAIAKATEDFLASAIAAITAGTLGVRAPRAESVDPVEREMERIARKMVKDKLAAANISLPKGDAKLKFEDGSEFTLEDLVDRQLSKAEEAIKKEAVKSLKAKADAKAKAAATAEAAKTSGPVSAESLGF